MIQTTDQPGDSERKKIPLIPGLLTKETAFPLNIELLPVNGYELKNVGGQEVYTNEENYFYRVVLRGLPVLRDGSELRSTRAGPDNRDDFLP
ncbi:MAG: hypothetical protein J7M32_09440 [Deltaproteobacteria bacterium]|nr:hypothetical protein [Deltaproteobacteria bacterium]